LLRIGLGYKASSKNATKQQLPDQGELLRRQQSLDKSTLWLVHVCEPAPRTSRLIRANSCADMPVALATTGGTSRGHGLILAKLVTVLTAAEAQARSAKGKKRIIASPGTEGQIGSKFGKKTQRRRPLAIGQGAAGLS